MLIAEGGVEIEPAEPEAIGETVCFFGGTGDILASRWCGGWQNQREPCSRPYPDSGCGGHLRHTRDHSLGGQQEGGH